MEGITPLDVFKAPRPVHKKKTLASVKGIHETMNAVINNISNKKQGKRTNKTTSSDSTVPNITEAAKEEMKRAIKEEIMQEIKKEIKQEVKKEEPDETPIEGTFHRTTALIAGIDQYTQTELTAGRKRGSKLKRDNSYWNNQSTLVFVVDEETNTDPNDIPVTDAPDLFPKKYARVGLKAPSKNGPKHHRKNFIPKKK